MTHWTPAKHMSGHLDRWLLITLANSQVNPDLPGTRCSWTFFQTASNQLGIHISQLPKNGSNTEFDLEFVCNLNLQVPFLVGEGTAVALETEICRRSIHPQKFTSCTAYLTIYEQFCASKMMITRFLYLQISECPLILCTVKSSSPTSTNSSESHFLELFFSTFLFTPFFRMKKWENCQLFRKTSSIENESRDVMKSRHGRANRIHHLQIRGKRRRRRKCDRSLGGFLGFNGTQGLAMCRFYKTTALPKRMYKII